MNYDTAAATCIANGMAIFDADSVQTENMLSSYANVQWPYGTFWVYGKSGTLCSALSDAGQTDFAKKNLTCSTAYHFICAFIGIWILNDSKKTNLVNFPATSPNVVKPEEPVEEPYKVCTAIKNIKYDNGTLIKTLCSVIQLQSYNNAQTVCNSNQMQVAKLEDATVQNAVLAFTGSQYNWMIPGNIWVDASKPLGTCSYLTNLGQTNPATYTLSSATCSSTFNYYCEYK